MDGSILEFFTGFCSYLQDHSFPVSESELARLVRSIGEAGIDITKEEEVVTASTVCLAKTGEQVGMIRLLFREYVMQKILPVTEQEQEAQKKERKEALDALTQDRLKKISDLEKEKERIREDVLAKAQQEKKSAKKGTKKMECGVSGLPEPEKRLLKALISGKELADEDLKALAKSLMDQAGKDLAAGKLAQAQEAMDLAKKAGACRTKQTKKAEDLQKAIENAQKSTEKQIETMRREITKAEAEYRTACQKIDDALRKQKQKAETRKDSLTVKDHSVLHRAAFTGGGSVQVLAPEVEKIAEKPFNRLSDADKALVRDYLRQNLLTFKTRMTRNINSYQRLSMNLEETLREAIRTCGKPMNLIYKLPRRGKADLVLILDVSGSCKAASELMLTFIGILKEIFPRGCSAFAFVNSLYDISGIFETGNVEESVREVLDLIPRAGQYSNYEVPLRDMWERHRNRITKDSMVIFIGDARNNKNDPGKEYIRNICRKAKHAYWLNTDVSDKWDQGDSIASVYGHYARMYETVNIQQLLGFIMEMR